MHTQYSCACSVCNSPLASGDQAEPKVPAIYEELIRRIYEQQTNEGGIDNTTAADTADAFLQATFKGYGDTLSGVAYNSPDYKMLEALTRDVYKFSAAKNYSLLKDLSLSLTDGDRVRSFTEFRREALKKVDTWVNAWGQAEYNTIVSTAHHNADWQRFKENADTMPLLKRMGVHDAKECSICAIYDGLTAPIDDPVWDYAYGDLHFQDRCKMIQTADGEAWPADKIPGPEGIRDKSFRVNLAKKMLVIPPGHSYYKNLPKEIRHKDITLQRIEVRKWAKANLAGNTYHSPIGDVAVTRKNIHDAVGKGSHDYEFEKNTAMYQLPHLLRHGIPVERDVKDNQGRPNIKWHYLQVDIAKGSSYLNIYEDTRTGKKYFHAITDKIQ